MVTDILARSPVVRVAGPEQLVEHPCGRRPVDGVIDLPGVTSGKKEAAPGLLAARAGAAAGAGAG